jgi:hypothetical protein
VAKIEISITYLLKMLYNCCIKFSQLFRRVRVEGLSHSRWKAVLNSGRGIFDSHINCDLESEDRCFWKFEVLISNFLFLINLANRLAKRLLAIIFKALFLMN